MPRKNRTPRKKGKGHEKPCVICGETRETVDAHFPKPNRLGGKKTILLCPTHHRLLDNGRLWKLDYQALWKHVSPRQFDAVDEFVEWACENQYPYCVSDLQRKFWYDESQRITRRLVIEETILGSPISALYAVEFGKAPFTVGAPHHAPGGTEKLPFGKESDENVGFLALDLAKLLQGKCVIAANYWYDVNKDVGDYLRYVENQRMDTFIEIHAHNGQKSSFDVEISCGSEKLSDKSEQLAKSVMDFVKDKSISGIDDEVWMSIKNISVQGEFSKLKYPATKTVSLRLVRRAQRIPYHIEISPRIRKNGDDRVPREGKALMQIIAGAIRKLHSLRC